ncbi:BTAD domain-containing putative transcriptional regulator [Virgibacillus sp. C22-A2]|uniref:BTAD domain-containing putative transcriptional regulator n=1 Tax=Virgibacillus tibetensis TaxID=3042313 RepID=A0ABU6KKH0_9BACI|nr:BTAD domain-containing putative transcriptional regulator [Virgibacillus sp. C22-A2]
MRNIPIIQSQLTPPPIRDRFVRRNKLSKKLMAIQKKPLTLLIAGAGYGKSTTLSLYMHDVNTESCWYSISHRDDDILPFLTKLLQSIRQKHPMFGESIMKELDTLDNYISSEIIYSFASHFINEVMELESQIVIILDDFHHVINSNDIEMFVLYLVDHVPSNLHIVISSRNKPKWDAMAKLKMEGELLEITQTDLSLSPDEMYFILEDIYHLRVKDEDIDKIYQLTEGWTIAFNMLAQQLNGDTTVEKVIQNRQSSLEDLFDYLASEVLSKQSLIMQQFLLQSSVMEILSPVGCDHILQINGSGEILAGLVEQNLFIVSGEGHYYRYHALFKAFLENRLFKTYKNEYEGLHKRAGNYYEREGNIEAALYHYRKIKEYNTIAYLLNKHGLQILQSGRHQNLYEMLLVLPNEYKNIYPLLYFFQGEIERYRSLFEQAEKNYEKILAIISEDDQSYYYLAGLALEGKARIYLDTIQPDRAERFVNQAIHMREKANAPKEKMSQLYQLMAENLLNAGQAVKAENWFNRAKLLDLPMEESNLQARIYLRTGRLAKAKDFLMKQKLTNQEKNKKHLSQSHRETDLILSIIEAFMGNADESKQLASDGIQLGLSIQSPFVEACGWMRMGHAIQLVDYYDMDLAIQCYETALQLMGEINVSRGKAEPYMGLSILYGKRLAYETAIENAKKGLIETEKVNDRWLSAFIKIGIGIAEVYNKNMNAAIKVIDGAQADMLACGDRYGIMVTAFWGAYISLEKGDERKFKLEMEVFLQEVQAEEFSFFLKKPTAFGPTDLQNIAPMLLKAKDLEIAPQFTAQLIYELGFAGNIKRHPGYTLVIHTLGQLNVWKGTKKIEHQEWQREKAKELFVLFVTNRSKLLLKEEIYHYLWPNEEETVAEKKFKVTLNALLKALDPQRKAREESFFVFRKGSGYKLNPHAGYELDIIIFEDFISRGLKEKEPKRSGELLEKGLKLYRGDYLEDFRTLSWSAAERHRLQLLFLRGAEKRAQLAVRLLEFNLCIDWCEKILEKDNTWEEAYRLIMYSYYQNNNRPQAVRWYEKCCDILEEELGVEPMDSTREMYHLIIGSEELDVY